MITIYFVINKDGTASTIAPTWDNGAFFRKGGGHCVVKFIYY